MAILDSILPGLSLGGSILGSALSSATQKGGNYKQLPTLAPNQVAAQNQGLQSALGSLRDPYAGFQPIENQARQQFNQQTVPSLAERFTSMGGGQRSSAFQGSLGQAAAGLDTNLAALRSQYGLHNRAEAHQLLNTGLQPQFQTVYQQPRQTFLSSLFGGASKGLGSLGLMGLGEQFGLYGQGQQPYFGAQPSGADQTGLLQQLLEALQQQRPTPQQQQFSQRFGGVGYPATPGEGQENFQRSLLRGII